MRRITWAAAAAVTFGGLAGVGATGIQAAAAETHSNCVTFDSGGNIVGVVPNCSATLTIKNQSLSMPSPNPCSGTPGTVTETLSNQIFHETVNGAGDVWLTSTATGSAGFVPLDGTQPSYSGHTTSWMGESLNRNNAALTETLSITLRGTDGSTISAHMVNHLNFSATGIVNTFSLGGFTCG